MRAQERRQQENWVVLIQPGVSRRVLELKMAVGCGHDWEDKNSVEEVEENERELVMFGAHNCEFSWPLFCSTWRKSTAKEPEKTTPCLLCNPTTMAPTTPTAAPCSTSWSGCLLLLKCFQPIKVRISFVTTPKLMLYH